MAILIFSRLACILCMCLVFSSLCGCSNLGARARHAAAVAARDPWFWGPLAGAAVVAATNNDERISRWARANTPVYGSPEAASAASDRFRLYASQSAWAIALAAPPKNGGNWVTEKGMDTSGNLVGLAFARTSTGLLKSAAKRERPNGSATHDSFPSSHASDAFAHASLARYYANDLPVYQPLREGMQWATNGFAVATAWGRVEGGFHYPTDVLVGAALANFTTRYFMKMEASNAKSDWRVRPRTDQNGEVIIEIQKPL